MNIEQYRKFLISDEQIKAERLHADRLTYVWQNLYIPFYSNMDFWKNTNFSKIKKGCVEYSGPGGKIYISGDASFNFKKGIKNKSYQKYEYFEELLTQDYSEEKLQPHLDKLKCCNLMFHSLHNFSLMPVTGGLNNFKGSSVAMKDGKHHLDRLDRFLFLLDKYYNDRCIDNPIFSKAHGQRSKEHSVIENTNFIKEKLKQFLDYIGSVNKYCEYFYLIKNEDLIKELITNGEKPIDSKDAIINYMKLAKDFWAVRHEIIKMQIDYL